MTHKDRWTALASDEKESTNDESGSEKYLSLVGNSKQNPCPRRPQLSLLFQGKDTTVHAWLVWLPAQTEHAKHGTHFFPLFSLAGVHFLLSPPLSHCVVLDKDI